MEYPSRGTPNARSVLVGASVIRVLRITSGGDDGGLVCLWVRESLTADLSASHVGRQLCTLELSAAIADSAAAAGSIEDAELIVSELVTHALTAGAASIVLELELHRAHLRLSVISDSPWSPATEHVDPGRALHVVDQLAQHWCVDGAPGGLQVWAVIPVPRGATAGLTCTVTNLI
jgi:hypothetical protein